MEFLGTTPSRLRSRSLVLGSRLLTLVATTTIALSTHLLPAQAGDPFRVENPRAIDNKTEAAFRAVFEESNYPTAKDLLREADQGDPLTFALRAAFAYNAQNLEGFRLNGVRTREVAEDLVASDPLRGNLYIAVGHFLEGAYILLNEGTVSGTPKALSKLQEVFRYIKAAERIDATDPELNMIKGFMDLMLAVNLPFANAEEAIARLDRYAGPRYLANYGIALGYRDLGNYPKALEYIDKALEKLPSHPQMLYTKAQILYRQAERTKNPALYSQAGTYFQQSLSKSNQLPRQLVWQIFFEYCNNQEKIDNRGRQCVALRDSIDLKASDWGPAPTDLPKLN